ncbi:uncharacterized protein [Chelonus insularis]|uniref:uncharacterized protein n=1 Tax=Chelonus insularis TaxID=460826 RepID=UPI00158C5542|nr:uncharacterized protein LOC118074557 [Chelonus insularis]
MVSPNHVCSRKHKNFTELNPEEIEDISESVDELRERLSNAKRMMKEQSAHTLNDITGSKRKRSGTDVLDGNLLSIIFGGVFIVVVSASLWAFYNLYHAVLKKFPSHHTEL